MGASSPRVVWHAGRACLDRPTISGCTTGNNHANSGLGLFCATGPHDYIAGFGGWVYRMELAADLRIMRMETLDLAKMGRQFHDRDEFDRYGRELARQYDLIELAEINGDVAQCIILNDEAIVACQRMGIADFQEMAVQYPPRQPSPKMGR